MFQGNLSKAFKRKMLSSIFGTLFTHLFHMGTVCREFHLLVWTLPNLEEVFLINIFFSHTKKEGTLGFQDKCCNVFGNVEFQGTFSTGTFCVDLGALQEEQCW